MTNKKNIKLTDKDVLNDIALTHNKLIFKLKNEFSDYKPNRDASISSKLNTLCELADRKKRFDKCPSIISSFIDDAFGTYGYLSKKSFDAYLNYFIDMHAYFELDTEEEKNEK